VIIGYARVSTDGQTLDAQQAAHMAAGAARIFAETVSGAVTDRRQLARAIAALGAGDTLLVTRLEPAGAVNAGSAQRPRRNQQSSSWL
jgi:DNA invertase Pin-like site-specific DNA recombinase